MMLLTGEEGGERKIKAEREQTVLLFRKRRRFCRHHLRKKALRRRLRAITFCRKLLKRLPRELQRKKKLAKIKEGAWLSRARSSKRGPQPRFLIGKEKRLLRQQAIILRSEAATYPLFLLLRPGNTCRASYAAGRKKIFLFMPRTHSRNFGQHGTAKCTLADWDLQHHYSRQFSMQRPFSCT